MCFSLGGGKMAVWSKTVKRWYLLALVPVVFSCASLSQEYVSKTIPDTPVGKRFSEILSVINSGDYATVAEYVAKNYSRQYMDQGSVSRHVDTLMRLHTNSGQLEFYGVRSSSRYRIIGILRETLMDVYTAFGIAVEKRRPFGIESIFYGPADSPHESSAIVTEGQVISQMESLLDRLAEADVYSGVVLIAKDDKILLCKAYGYASRTPMISNTIETRFNIGSIGKLFTAVAVAQLVERGELSVDDPLGMHLGQDWLPEEISEKVKIGHLLTHTSGLSDYMEHPGFKAAAGSVSTLDNYKAFIADEHLLFEPGSRWSYSNSGFLLLGAVIERVTGQSYSDYLNGHVFGPADMVGTLDAVFEEEQFPAPDFAVGYTREFTEHGAAWRDNLDLLEITRASPAGGGFISAEDLFKFSVALKNGTLISEETKNVFWSAKPELNAPLHGFGFEVKTRNGESMVGHGGSHEGIGAMFRMYINSGYTLIVLSNCGRIMAFSLANKFSDLIS
jgi:CubicO group peptidase (beta-lactamase class C family)